MFVLRTARIRQLTKGDCVYGAEVDGALGVHHELAHAPHLPAQKALGRLGDPEHEIDGESCNAKVITRCMVNGSGGVYRGPAGCSIVKMEDGVDDAGKAVWRCRA